VTGRKPKLARRLIEPTWESRPTYVETFGPEVCDIAAMAGLEPEPEQARWLDGLFAIGPDGKSVSFENALIGPRQVMGKTGTLNMAHLGWLYVTEQKFIVHSAHEKDASEKAFNELRDLIEGTPQLAKHLDPTVGRWDSRGITSGNNSWAINVLDRRGDRLVLKYKARTRTGGRALTAWKVVLDEAFSVTRAQVGSLYPTLSAVPDPQVVLASSAGLLESDVLRDTRNRGRAGQDPRLLYAEYGDDVEALGDCADPKCRHPRPPFNTPGCIYDDESRWARFMTGLGRRVTVQTIRDMRRSMPVDEFAREFFVHWEDPPERDDDADRVLNLARWSRPTAEGGCRDSNTPAPHRVELFLDVSPDRKSSTIAAAGDAPGGRTVVLTTTLPGTASAVEALARLVEKRDVVSPVALVPNTQAGALIPDLVKAGVAWEPFTSTQMGQATAAFITAVDDGQVVHVGQVELDEAVENATTRFTGEAEVWDRRNKTINIGPVVAASGAAFRWAMTKQVPEEPPAPPRRGASPETRRRRSNDVARMGF